MWLTFAILAFLFSFRTWFSLVYCMDFIALLCFATDFSVGLSLMPLFDFIQLFALLYNISFIIIDGFCGDRSAFAFGFWVFVLVICSFWGWFALFCVIIRVFVDLLLAARLFNAGCTERFVLLSASWGAGWFLILRGADWRKTLIYGEWKTLIFG